MLGGERGVSLEVVISGMLLIKPEEGQVCQPAGESGAPTCVTPAPAPQVDIWSGMEPAKVRNTAGWKTDPLYGTGRSHSVVEDNRSRGW